MKTYNPHDLITPFRFDVIIKYMYAKSIINGYDTDYFKDVYQEHLWIWNKFKEFDNPDKNTFEAFDNAFKDIIKSLGDGGFDSSISTIPIHNESILNGAHRLASSIALNKDVICRDGVVGVDGMVNCNWEFFNGLNLDPAYADRTAIEYAKLKPNTHMVFLFPSSTLDPMATKKNLNKYGKVVYHRDVSLNKTGSFNLMRELYLGEAWAGDFNSGFGGFHHKDNLCYPIHYPTNCYLVEFDDLESSVKAKEVIRALSGIGKNSVHINDTHEETVRLAKLMFNRNSRHHLNNAKTVNYKVFDKCLDDFKNKITQLGLDIDDYCVTASSTLSAYGLREGNDLDYLHFNPTLITNESDLIHSHNGYGVDWYPFNRDEIIYNPKNHFYHRGVKFASLDVIKSLKEKRGEPKDIIDIELIKTIK